MKKWEGYVHGINLGGWLSQCDHTKERYDTFIKEEDIARISKWEKIDHIRIPVDYDLVENADGTYKEEGFAYIEKAIGWAKKYDLNMILDLHKTFGYSFDAGEGEEGFFENEAYQERFYRLWEQFAKRFGGYSPMLAFELLNEVTDKEYGPVWNVIATRCIERIRKICPAIKILIGGYYNNSVEAVKDLPVPFDENIVYNFHCYEPILFTHQGAYWIDTMNPSFRLPFDADMKTHRQKTDEIFPGRPVFPWAKEEQTYDEALVEELFREAVETAEERNVPLYCGEYGVIELAEAEDTLKWYKVMSAVFDKLGIGRAAWTYKEMDFGLIDPHMDAVRDEVLGLL